ncbi:N-acetyl sugar amidotransferase [Candidatus Synechococcus calcipolaris G9]|uniref:N-acetyl sugar amidotransferase n=1 Tax=Candidatus Synechococcus calcipolaris G9 TaxID=1497997 RepID=A0ABT6EUP6_9SYNE|nr:N-acetyl sugar amidotransferase [Candidatus Synechococcus calcipolaris]MDG2989577.1 N-acetyl sugar amidotransferase [Candidatus Synechococcus calcipolaris G9]
MSKDSNGVFQQCTRCVMDTSVDDIIFNENGICNYCTNFLEEAKPITEETEENRKIRLKNFVAQVKQSGKNKPYDCVVGVSGGVDSSWTLVQVVQLGLCPLAVHMDNGWNSELAQNNIANLVRGLGVDLYTHVIDWQEYRALMQAFFDADVIDIELLYDNAMLAVNYQQADRHGVKFILSGVNQATEGMRMPQKWNWFKWDRRNIKALGQRFGHIKLKTFPAMGTLDYIYYEIFKKIKWVSFLDFLPYNKFDALNILEKEFSYKRYPYKHYESIFTRFYQGYLLPKKFNVDKRKLHLSTLVISGQMSREEALESLKGIAYLDEQSLQNDIDYFLKKMQWTPEQLENYLARPEIPHDFYPTEKPFWDFAYRVYQTIKNR